MKKYCARKTFYFQCLYIFLLSEIIRCRANPEQPCNAFSLGNCGINPSYIFKQKEKNDELECQKFCKSNDCNVFQYNHTSRICTLTDYNYRQECTNVGLPYNALYSECIKEDGYECDHFIDEECQYLGKVVLEAQPGTIADPDHCHALCNIFSDLNCNYWYYNMETFDCILFDSSIRDCSAISGLKTPNIKDCPETYNVTTTTEAATTETETTTPRKTTTTTLGISTTEKKPISTTEKKPSYQCNDLILGSCHLDESNIFYSVHANNITHCMMLCEVDSNPHCKSFMYESNTNKCDLLNIEVDDYIERCDHFGASDDTLKNCYSDNDKYTDPCKGIMESDCQLLGNILDENTGINSEEECFQRKLGEENAEYFFFEREFNICQVIDSSDRECHIYRGPKGLSHCDVA